MATVIDVADYVVIKHGATSAWTLHKFVYWSQTWHLCWYDEPLFKEPFEAWPTGPVSPLLERITKSMTTIDRIPGGCGALLTKKQKRTVDKVVKYYDQLPGATLTVISKREPPWIIANLEAKPGTFGLITWNSMREYAQLLDNA